MWEVNKFRGKTFVFMDLIWKGRLRTFPNQYKWEMARNLSISRCGKMVGMNLIKGGLSEGRGIITV